jgi:hypothetical protein
MVDVPRPDRDRRPRNAIGAIGGAASIGGHHGSFSNGDCGVGGTFPLVLPPVLLLVGVLIRSWPRMTYSRYCAGTCPVSFWMATAASSLRLLLRV